MCFFSGRIEASLDFKLHYEVKHIAFLVIINKFNNRVNKTIQNTIGFKFILLRNIYNVISKKSIFFFTRKNASYQAMISLLIVTVILIFFFVKNSIIERRFVLCTVAVICRGWDCSDHPYPAEYPRSHFIAQGRLWVLRISGYRRFARMMSSIDSGIYFENKLVISRSLPIVEVVFTKARKDISPLLSKRRIEE